MDEDNQHLLQTLIPSTTTNVAVTGIYAAVIGIYAATTKLVDAKNINNIKVLPSNSGIIFRLILIISIGLISIWANHEASKGFSITIFNEAGETLSGKRFNLFYVSNDEASRLVLTTSNFVENFLYPNGSYPKKIVNQVILRLASRNLTRPVIVDSGEDHGQFVLHISPSVLEEINFRHATFVAVQHGMARTWLWDGLGNAPTNLINGIVEYISKLAVSAAGHSSFDFESTELDSHCWKIENPKAVAQLLNSCELRKPGFIRRLNQALKNGWHDRMVNDAC